MRAGGCPPCYSTRPEEGARRCGLRTAAVAAACILAEGGEAGLVGWGLILIRVLGRRTNCKNWWGFVGAH
jgi:hypothetical protein